MYTNILDDGAKPKVMQEIGNKLDGGGCLLEGGVFLGAYGKSYAFVSIYISNNLWK